MKRELNCLTSDSLSSVRYNWQGRSKFLSLLLGCTRSLSRPLNVHNATLYRPLQATTADPIDERTRGGLSHFERLSQLNSLSLSYFSSLFFLYKKIREGRPFRVSSSAPALISFDRRRATGIEENQRFALKPSIPIVNPSSSSSWLYS